MSGFKSRMRLRDFLKFSKPKTLGYGISRDFYLSVLAATARLPVLRDIANPTGANGAVVGYAAPLDQRATKDALDLPISSGVYVIGSADRKTILRMTVMPKDETGFDPEVALSSPEASRLDPEAALRIRSVWNILQLSFEAHAPIPFSSLDFLHACAGRLGQLTNGVVADPLAERYLLPEQVGQYRLEGSPVDARNIVSLFARILQTGVHLYTRGMAKFALPEFEVEGVEEGTLAEAESFLIGLCQTVLTSGPVKAGQNVGSEKMTFTLAEGGHDRTLWGDTKVLELLPPTGVKVSEAIRAFLLEYSKQI